MHSGLIMDIQYDKLEILKQLEDRVKQCAVAKQLFDEVSEPLLFDYSLVPYLHEVFCEIVGENKLYGELRDIFVFIVLYLYAPDKLCGGSVPSGLRKEVGSILGLHAFSVVSRIKEYALFRYETFFHDEADRIFYLMIHRMQEDEIL